MSLGFYRGNKNALLANAMHVAGVERVGMHPLRDDAALATALDEAGVLTPAQNVEMSKTALGSTFNVGATKMERGQALQMGYTGDQCDNCNSMKMKISGHCMVCEDCGTTTGCS